MRVLTGKLAVTCWLAAGAAGLLLPATQLPAQAAAAASAAGGGGCYPIDFTWICVSGSGSPGSPGSGGSAKYTCTYTKASPALLQRAGVGPPSPGYQWDIMTCPGSNSGPLGGQLVQVSIATGAPAISPVDLLKVAIGELSVPTLTARTAPPVGKNGLVGLPEWFWVPSSQWRKISITVTAGPVWADAVAGPTSLTFTPGGGLPDVSCAGPGAAFKRGSPARSQHTNCSYTYERPSAGQPGNAYQAALVVTWTISWTGSGGAGGTITTGYTTGAAFGVRVAQAEALVSTP